ncbi:YbaN family protein [Bacillus sp. Marseille-P3661]|uniref:YbaN family protein n=1 Tax=Bacillus sp. Marseille-P3661 TaxID=1936234 RepID=UPI0015E1776E|nr:YbaN family protein [Bacillus sp. Marseille-P3661]
MAHFSKFLLLTVGCISIILGLVGILLPLIPTTPFLLLAAACFVRSSPRLYERLMKSKVLGPYIESFRSGEGLPVKSKIKIIVLFLITISYSIYVVKPIAVKIVLMFIALAITAFIIGIKTKKQ